MQIFGADLNRVNQYQRQSSEEWLQQTEVVGLEGLLSSYDDEC